MKPAHRYRGAAAGLALFAINAWIAGRLFTSAYIRQMGSIEAAFVGLSTYIRAHFSGLQWFPLWYGGIAFPDSYPPLLHVTVAALSAVSGFSPALAYHAVTATVYALAPVALYWAARRLGAARVPAFAGALLYSVVSPACFLIRSVRADTGGWFGPRRLETLVRYGEGPHALSLLLLPVAIALFDAALRKRRPILYCGAACAAAAVALSNWLGTFALAMAVLAYLLAAAPVSARVWLRALGIGAGAYALAAAWLPPSTIRVIFANAPRVGGVFESTGAQRALSALFLTLLVLLAWGLRKTGVAPPARFALAFLFVTAGITLAAEWLHVRLVPQAERYHLEMDLAFWLAAALVAPAIRLRARAWGAVAAALGLLVVPVAVHQASLGRAMTEPIDIESTVEYRVSSWLGSRMPGSRVFAPGSIGFWMNAFSETPLLTGGFDNGMRNTFLQDVIYQIYAGDDQRTALDWLRAFGCDAVVGGGPESREVYHPYAHPEKLAGLEELWRDGGDVIYSVPRARRSLAHTVRAQDLPPIRPPAYDSRPLAPYLAALDDPALPPAEFRWSGSSATVITADLRPEHLLSVQVTYAAGWSARVNGAPRRLWSDTLGQIVIEPMCNGPCKVNLTYDGGAEMLAAVWAGRLAMAGGVLWIILWRRRAGSPKTN